MLAQYHQTYTIRNSNKEDLKAAKAEEKGEGEQNGGQYDKQSQPKSSGTKEDSAVEPHGRNGSTPSNILEKGQLWYGSKSHNPAQKVLT